MESESQNQQSLPASISSSGPTVVGIGASAGGLAALRQFFECIPEDSGLAFVVVVHLSPEHKSHLPDILQSSVRFPVQQVTETVPLEENRVYVIPPNANLSAIDTHLRLSRLEEQRRERAPIDHFFRTLASTHDGHSIGVILTGTGSDGTLGLREIKARGGLILVQDPNEAEFDGMPQSAIATGLVDRVLPIQEIAAALLRLVELEHRIPLTENSREPAQPELALLPKVLAILRTRTERDFSRYKPATVLRRIGRRMQLNYIDDFGQYIEVLREQPEEARSLADDLLITVTSFFRDPDVFSKLQQDIVPKLFDSKGAGDTLRVWSVGCATGEEAYSVAMLLLEEASRRQDPPKIQIFASDLHKRSLDGAREGLYSGDIATDVSPERLTKFFQKENGGYRICKEVRDTVVFAPHNLLGDPPFSRLDLITCRNLLIYLDRAVQRDVIDLFHYALSPHGYLLLGSAETIDSAELFRTEDKRLCIYQKRNVPAPEPRLPVFPLTRLRATGEPPARHENSLVNVPYHSVHQGLLERYAPPSILVGPDNKLVHLSEHAGRYLVHPGGEVTSGVLRLVREELRIELQALLVAAREKREPVDSNVVQVRFDGYSAPIVMHVRPSDGPDQDQFVLVIFEERQAVASDNGRRGGHAARSPAQDDDAHRIAQLETELNIARQRLQTIIEEYETSQEEMKAANEEMQSTNEELRSTMEELETSKEELQSINEELQTVNQENRHKVEELSQLSGDLQNLLSATDIATLFLDRDLRILRFTPRLAELFNIRVTDRGRPILDLTHRLGYVHLREDAQAVLDRLIPVEHEIRDVAGRWYLTRVLPYRSTEDRIEGVVITFVDITARKEAEAALRSSDERHRGELEELVMARTRELQENRDLLQATMDSSMDMIQVFKAIRNSNGEIVDFAWILNNHTSSQVYGDVIGKSLLENNPGVVQEEIFANFKRVVESGESHQAEHHYVHEQFDGWFAQSAVKLYDGVATTTTDITARKKAEEQLAAQALHESEERFRLLVENVHEYALFQTGLEGKVTSWNPGAERLFGYSSAEMLEASANQLFTQEDQQAHLLEEELALAIEGKSGQEARWVVRKDGRRFWAQWITEPVRHGSGEIRGVAKVLRDETERKRAEERQLLLMGELNHRVKNTLATVQSLANQTLRSTPDPVHFAENFQARLQTLSRAHTLLTRTHWEGADTRDIVRDQFATDDRSDAIYWSGPSAYLTPQSAIALSLVLHELETNARKHGALSSTDGKVRLLWEVLEPDAMLQLQWAESAGPTVPLPEKRGFGTTLIERSLAGIGGSAQTDFRPEGVVCSIQVPLAPARDPLTEVAK